MKFYKRKIIINGHLTEVNVPESLKIKIDEFQNKSSGLKTIE